MKILAYLSLLTLCSALHAQSYWFGGMTRVPGGIEGSVGSPCHWRTKQLK